MAPTNKWKIILAFAAVYIVWGSTYIAILIGLKGLPPFLMSGIRFLLAGAILYGWCMLKGEKLPGLSSLKTNSLLGVFMLCGGTVSVTWAEQYIPSSVAAIIVTTVPFWFVLFDKKQWSFYFSNKSIIAGLLLGFAGVLILVGFNHSGSSVYSTAGNRLAGILAILCGGIGWTLGSLYTRYKPTGSSLLINGTVQLLAAGVFCMLVSIISGEINHFSFSEVSRPAWLALVYLITMGSLVAYLSYLFLLKVKPPAQVSTYVYVNPIVAVLLGAIIIGEKIRLFQVTALVVILFGVLLVNLPKYKLQTNK